MSIKNKFATAVATASLLAGLFGSAFVPSALAARDIALDTPSVAKTETRSADYNVVVPVMGADADVDGLERSFWMSTIAREYQSEYGDAAGDDLGDIEFDGITAANDVADDIQSITYKLYTKTGGGIAVADLKATSSSSVIKLFWAYTDGGADSTCEGAGVDEALTDTVTDVTELGAGSESYTLCLVSNNKPGVATIAVVANGVTLAPITITVLGDLASLSVTADGTYVAEDNDEVDGFYTVIGKDSAGNVLNGPQLGVGGGLYLDDAVFGSDLYGSETNPVNAQDAEITFIATGSELDEAQNAYEYDNQSWTKYDLPSFVCVSETATGENDGDAGKSYSLKAAQEDSDNDEVLANSISITCTGPGSDAKLSKFEVEATSGDLEYTDDVDDAISIYGYFVDQAGRPLGAGADLDLATDFGLDYSASSSFSTELDIDLDTDVTTDGTTKIEIGYLTPEMAYVAKFPYTISVDSSDLQSATAVAKSLATFYTATNPDAIAYALTVVRSNAKTRATITVNFGAECSNQMVDFDVELANGDVKFLTRRANINGVAVLNFERRNTKVYVTAFCNDGDQYTALRGIRFR